MSRAVLDTSVLIASGVQPLPGQLAISVISLAELSHGVLVATSGDARATPLARLTGLPNRFDPLPVDEVVVDSYGRIAAKIVNSGRRRSTARPPTSPAVRRRCQGEGLTVLGLPFRTTGSCRQPGSGTCGRRSAGLVARQLVLGEGRGVPLRH